MLEHYIEKMSEAFEDLRKIDLETKEYNEKMQMAIRKPHLSYYIGNDAYALSKSIEVNIANACKKTLMIRNIMAEASEKLGPFAYKRIDIALEFFSNLKYYTTKKECAQ